MSEEEHEKKGFRVVDRRRFNAEGETRGDVPARPEPPPVQVPPRRENPRGAAETPQTAARDSNAAGNNRSADVRATNGHPAASQPAAQRDSHQHVTETPSNDPGGIDFISFIASLATNALASLGALPEARAQGVPMSLDMAREYIEIVGMLQAKTRGNLTREEEASLQRIVSELRMVYVEVTQRIAKGPPQPQR